MHTDVIISSRYDSLLCWLLRCLLLSQCNKDTNFSGGLFFCCFFSHSPLEHSSHAGEQHRATGCASWGGSGCAKEHLWYGLPEGGQTRTSTSQWYVCPSRLLQQYVYTSWCFFFCFFYDSWDSGDSPHLNILHKKPNLFLSKICLVGQQCWSWISVLSPKLLCPHTHIVRIVNAHACMHTHTHTILSTATTSTVFCLPLSVDGFSHPTCSWSPRSWAADSQISTEQRFSVWFSVAIK